MSDRFIPQIAGFYLNIVSVSNGFTSSVIKHEYPFSNRNKLENTGQNTRTYTVDCVFMANPPITQGWEPSTAIFPTYESFLNFKATLEQTREPVDFIHPVFGEMSGMVEGFSSVDDETKKFASVSFTFVEEVTSDESTFVLYILPAQGVQFRLASAGISDRLAELQRLAASLRAFVATMAAFKGKLDAYLNRIVSAATSIKNTVDYVQGLPGEIVSSINSAIDRLVVSFATASSSPAAFINNITQATRDLADTFTDATQRTAVIVLGASRVAYEAGNVYQEDDKKRDKISKKEKKASFDAAGNYVGGDPIPDAMTAQELEETLFNVKALIYDALLLDRENAPLRDQAKTLQTYINEIKLSRERMETQELPMQSLHTTAIMNGMNYQSAERILKLNPHIKNPTFASGAVKVIFPRSANG